MHRTNYDTPDEWFAVIDALWAAGVRWAWYIRNASGEYMTHIDVEDFFLAAGDVWPSESCMMIPGTYAEMRADYD